MFVLLDLLQLRFEMSLLYTCTLCKFRLVRRVEASVLERGDKLLHSRVFYVLSPYEYKMLNNGVCEAFVHGQEKVIFLITLLAQCCRVWIQFCSARWMM